MPKIKVAPSILTCDFGRLGEEVRAVVEAGADMVHLDIMDGHFTPNITFGPAVVARIREHSEVPLDVHLMLTDPDEYIDDFANAGADIITFHIEAAIHPHRTLHKIKELGCQAGVVLNPSTPEEEIEYLVDDLDMVLLMTVNPGFGGQSFIPQTLPKIRNVRAMMGDRDLEIDGGVDETTIHDIVKAGANVIVAGSFIFGAPSYMEAIETIKAAG